MEKLNASGVVKNIQAEWQAYNKACDEEERKDHIMERVVQATSSAGDNSNIIVSEANDVWLLY